VVQPLNRGDSIKDGRCRFAAALCGYLVTIVSMQKKTSNGLESTRSNERYSSHVDIDGLTRNSPERFRREVEGFLAVIRDAADLEIARSRLLEHVMHVRVINSMQEGDEWNRRVDRVRDCARALLTLLSARSDERAGFSITQVLWDIAQGRERPDLRAGFYAELMHVVWGIEGRTRDRSIEESRLLHSGLSGREAALLRSEELDKLADHVRHWMVRYEHGLEDSAIERRRRRVASILEQLGGDESDWESWEWQVENVAKDVESVEKLVAISKEERLNIAKACGNAIPFGVTPYYLSLMDDDATTGFDRAIRAQVFPPKRYVDEMVENRQDRGAAFDFMHEADTSPIDLITRRYPGIVILKPFNTCPQICVYCQRNWEIDEVLASHAMAPWEKIEAAINWIGEHSAIQEVLVTGGDPLLLGNEDLERILSLLADLPSILRIRIGTRTPVTMPMRFTQETVELLGKFREPARREVALCTHVEHPYEVTPQMAVAVDRLRREGIPVYNQLVYTFFVSRRYEAALLRRLLRQVGIDPYYTFLPKGKSETADYRVPLSRLLQEQTEEARLMPGLARTDEAVYNVPRLGKNYIRATHFRDLLSIRPDGVRVYEFHPWEKNIFEQESYVGEVTPILNYLHRLEQIGENPADYESIWYYF
jgi:lysine 2,3-aminomutase